MSKITIPLTSRRPVTIDEADWPVIAQADGDDFPGLDPARHVQASTQGELNEYRIEVRQYTHPVDGPDGRVIICGTYTEGWHSAHEGNNYAGELITRPLADPLGGVEHAIARVGGTLGVPAQLIDDCIADLPAEQL